MITILLMFWANLGWADDLSSAPALIPTVAPMQAPPQSAPQGHDILDFEADVIEGEKKRPDIFVEMGNQKQTMDSVIYRRKDFNDFHRSDRRWRPAYIEPKARGQ